MTDRAIGVAGAGGRLNVRRLMYQSLIWPAVLGDEARGLTAAFDAEDVKRLADALVDGVRRNPELRGDFLGRQMLVDEPQAIELAGGEASNPIFHLDPMRASVPMGAPRHAWLLFHCYSHSAQHRGLPEPESKRP